MDLELKDVRDNLREKDITLEVEKALLDHFGKKGFDPAFGARPLRRVIQNEVADRLSDALIKGQLSEGETIRLDYGDVTAEEIARAHPPESPEPPAKRSRSPPSRLEARCHYARRHPHSNALALSGLWRVARGAAGRAPQECRYQLRRVTKAGGLFVRRSDRWLAIRTIEPGQHYHGRNAPEQVDDECRLHERVHPCTRSSNEHKRDNGGAEPEN